MNGLTPEQRSKLMSRVRDKDTQPEIAVRRLIYGLGYRYRLHRRDLPGKPDLVFPGRKKVIFIHGCYWHRHACHRGQSMPSTNVGFWQAKFERTIRRDRVTKDKLRRQGWKCLVVWECQVKKQDRLKRRIKNFLDKE